MMASYFILCLLLTISRGSNIVELPIDILQEIASYLENPYGTIRVLNKRTLTGIPSAQDDLAMKFSAKEFKSLPSSTELWHLLNFQAGLSSLKQDPARFLPQSSNIIAQTLVRRILDQYLTITPSLFSELLVRIIRNQDVDLFVKLITRIPVQSLEFIPINFLNSVIIKLSQSEHDLNAALALITKESKTPFMTALLMSSLPIELKLHKLSLIPFRPQRLCIALLEAITLDDSNSNSYESYQNLLNHLDFSLNSNHYQAIVDALLNLKYSSDTFHLINFPALLEFKENRFQWKHYFLLLSIKLKNAHVFLQTIQSLSEISDEVKQELLNHPEMLALLDRPTAAKILKFDYLEYRILCDEIDFDENLTEVTAEDVIVSAYIHTDNKRFLQVLSRLYRLDFRDWAQVFIRLFEDSKLISKLKVFADYSQKINDFPDMIIPKISFPVLEAILLDVDAFAGLFNNRFLYTLIVTPSVMALVLRDDCLYQLLRKHKSLVLQKLFFSYYDAIPEFTYFDWQRLFALSDVTINFEYNPVSTAMIKALHQPLCLVPMVRSLDIIKMSFLSFIIAETSFDSIKKSPENYILYSPLLRIMDDQAFPWNRISIV